MPHPPGDGRTDGVSGRLLLTLVAGALAAQVLLLAWVAEDAFITFRVVDNAARGFGLRWNVDERVEVFTNPLWLLLHIPVRWITPNLFLGTLVVSVLMSLGAVVVAARSARRSAPFTAALLLAPLCLSKAFVEFATSGLENPLTFLLLAAFFAALVRAGDGPVPWFRLTLVAALAGVNRLDTVLLYLPVLCGLAARHRRSIPWSRVLLGLVPLIAWKAFALLYYGFPMPNTAYAKLVTGVPHATYLAQGLRYAADCLRRDPGLVLLGVAAAGLVLREARRTGVRALPDTGRGRVAGLFAGVVLYALYVVAVGGDFMSLRFWSVTGFATVLVVFGLAPDPPPPRALGIAVGVLFAARLVGIAAQPPAVVQGSAGVVRSWSGIDDERLKYRVGHAVFVPSRSPAFIFSLQGAMDAPLVVMWNAVGVKPYLCGPGTMVIDGVGLADALVARLPAMERDRFYIGHCARRVPQSYVVARFLNKPQFLPEDLARYWMPLKVVISAPVLDPVRLRTLVRFNLGRYDHWRDAYVAGGDPEPAAHDGFALAREDAPDAP